MFLGRSSSCDSWAEQDIDEVESKSSKKATRKKKGNKARTKEKQQNFLKRNIEVNFLGIFTILTFIFTLYQILKESFLCVHSVVRLSPKGNTGSRLFTEVKPCWTGLISSDHLDKIAPAVFLWEVRLASWTSFTPSTSTTNVA